MEYHYERIDNEFRYASVAIVPDPIDGDAMLFRIGYIDIRAFLRIERAAHSYVFQVTAL